MRDQPSRQPFRQSSNPDVLYPARIVQVLLWEGLDSPKYLTWSLVWVHRFKLDDTEHLRATDIDVSATRVHELSGLQCPPTLAAESRR